MCTVKVALDIGQSGSKSCYVIEDGSPQAMMMAPEILETSVKGMTTVLINHLKSEDGVWLRKNKKSASAIAVGMLAKNFQANSQVQITELKYESALYKIAGLIGAMIDKHQLPHELTAEIGVLLPYNEYSMRHVLEESLKKYLEKFYWRDQLLQINVSKFSCVPEGYGGLCYLGLTKGAEWLQTRQIAILSLGLRNMGFLLFQYGSFQSGKTSNLGFHMLLDKINERSSIQLELEELAPIIYAIGENISSEEKLVQFLLKSRNSKNRKKEAEQLVDAIQLARLEYWELGKAWLNSVVPRRLHEIIFLGGTGQYLRNELEEKYRWADMHWLDNLCESMLKILTLPGSPDKQKNLAYRFIDVYSYLSFISGHTKY